MEKKPNIIISFFRYNIVAIIATAVDFLLFWLLKDVFQFWYVLSSFLSALGGGITAFILNRNWVFETKDGLLLKQAIKYLSVWAGSIFLNTYGLYLIVENSTIEALQAKIIVAVFVGIFYNFLLSKYFIFKR